MRVFQNVVDRKRRAGQPESRVGCNEVNMPSHISSILIPRTVSSVRQQPVAIERCTLRRATSHSADCECKTGIAAPAGRNRIQANSYAHARCIEHCVSRGENHLRDTATIPRSNCIVRHWTVSQVHHIATADEHDNKSRQQPCLSQSPSICVCGVRGSDVIPLYGPICDRCSGSGWPSARRRCSG